jgi:bromodomain-containing factor 1
LNPEAPPQRKKLQRTLYFWERVARTIINGLLNHKYSWIFEKPVDPIKDKVPSYFTVIKKPMDFGTIKKKLLEIEYIKFQDFLDDIELVFANCNKFNDAKLPVI